MAIIKCKMCGGDITLAEDKTFGTCEYCGSTMTLPKVSDDQRAAAFNRGNHFRRMGEFDKALAVYERIVAEDDNDAEAHWCCALCRFGIEYVEDPATYEWLPTCHRASFDSFLEDVDYLAALEHSDGVTKRQYQKDAAKIADVQRGILATSQNEKPFDVFICYKESDENGERTVDSTLAQDIYYQLTDKGYRVFFSRITLEDKAGTEYEPYIFAALNSAKVMIAVGTKAEHFNAVWVKNEWSRFLALMRKDRTKLLLPCYRDMDPYDLPEQLSVLQSYDMSKIGFIQDLIRGVTKVLDAEKDMPASVKETVVVQQSVGGANLIAQLKRGQQALEDRDWKAADGFFDKVLDMDAECAEAFWGKALAAAQCSTGEELVQKRLAIKPTAVQRLNACEPDTERIENAVKNYVVPGYLSEQEIRSSFDYERGYDSLTAAWRERIEEETEFWKANRLLNRAARYAKGEFAEVFNGLRRTIGAMLQEGLHESESADQRAADELRQKYAGHMAQAENKVQLKHKTALEKRQADYENFCTAQERAKTADEFETAATNFRCGGMVGFEDCDARAEQCHAEAIRLINEENDRAARKAEQAAAKWKRARIIAVAMIAVIAVGALLATKVIIPGNKYRQAEALLAAGEYDEAATAFAELGRFKDSVTRISDVHYAEAEALLAAGEYGKAAIVFAEVGEFKDAADRSAALWNDVAVRDFVAAGGSHTVGLRADGTVVAVGSNGSGQCDIGDWTDIVSVAAGASHTVGLRADGSVVAAGSNRYGRCDVGDWTEIVAVAADGPHTVGLRADGSVVAAGGNDYGQCDVGDWADIVAVAAGGVYTVGLRADGTVVAAGGNGSGQCDVGNWTDIVAVAANDYHTVGLRADGTVVAVGSNGSGQCDVGDWTNIMAVTAGSHHTVGLRADGTVVAVGSNGSGQCDVGDWTEIVAVAADGSHTVGLRADGSVVAVGSNGSGQCDVTGWTGIKVP